MVQMNQHKQDMVVWGAWQILEMTEDLVCLKLSVARDKARELGKGQVLGFLLMPWQKIWTLSRMQSEVEGF